MTVARRGSRRLFLATVTFRKTNDDAKEHGRSPNVLLV